MTGLKQTALFRSLLAAVTLWLIAGCSADLIEETASNPLETKQVTADWIAVKQSATDSTLERGQRMFQMCAGCHGLAEGEFSPGGPSLYGVAGRNVGSIDGFPYTQAMANKPEVWSVEHMNTFIAAPQSVYPGTSMAYTGLNNPEDRAALIAFIASKSPL